MAAKAGGRSRSPRSDRLQNRERLLRGATMIVRAEGEGVPMMRLAEAAGVGVGTLYRHFPTREDLLRALSGRAFELVLQYATAAAARPGPAIEALGAFLEQSIVRRDELVLPLHGGPSELDADARATQARIRSTLAGILERGRAEGSIRADVTPRDVVIAGAQLAQPLAGVPEREWTAIARRQARFLLDGLRPVAPAGRSAAPPPTS